MHTKLAARAQALSERVYASLPWGYRLARLFMKIGEADELGPAFYAYFIDHGVVGMPKIKGEDPLKLRGDPKLADKLHRKKYGWDFGQRLFAIAMKQYGNLELIQDAIHDYWIRLTTGRGLGTGFRDGVDLRTAEGYVVQGVMNTIKDINRKKKRERPALVQQDERGVETQIDVKDPSAFKDFAQLMTAMDLKRALKEVRRFDPRASYWVEMHLKGYKDTEIAKWLDIKPGTLKRQQTRNWFPKLRGIFEKHKREAM